VKMGFAAANEPKYNCWVRGVVGKSLFWWTEADRFHRYFKPFRFQLRRLKLMRLFSVSLSFRLSLAPAQYTKITPVIYTGEAKAPSSHVLSRLAPFTSFPIRSLIQRKPTLFAIPLIYAYRLHHTSTITIITTTGSNCCCCCWGSQ